MKIYILEKNNIPFYIGKSNTPKKRLWHHKQKFGKNINQIILDKVREDEWKFWESYWIEQFRQWGFILENKNKGGGGPTKWNSEWDTQERKNAISNHPTRGDNISKSLINHSQHYTPQIRKKMSESQKGIPKPFTEEHIKNIKQAKLKQAKPVLQYDLDGNFIQEWESKGQAAKWLKKQTGRTSNLTSQIKDCILGRQKTCCNYIWKYK